MKSQSETEKNRIKLLYAVALHKAIKENSITSIRGLSAEAGMEYAHLQRVARGKVNVSITIHVAIINALKITFKTFGQYYDEITEKDIYDYNLEMKQQKSLRGRKKKRP